MFASLRHIWRSPKVLDPRKRAIVIALHLGGRILLFPWLLLRRRGGPAAPLDALGRPPRILLMRVDGVGDLMMTTALFPALRRAYPAGQIDLLCSTLVKSMAELFVRRGYVDRLHTLPLGNPPLGQVRKLIAALRAEHYDAAVDLRGDFRHVLLAWASGAPRRYGMAYAGLDYLLTQVQPAGEVGRVHQVEEVARAGEMLGVPDVPRAPQLDLPPDLRDWAARWLEERGAGDGRPIAAFHLSAGMPARLWPLERFIGVARRVQETHAARVLVVGAPDDRQQAETFSAALHEPAMIAAGQTSLVQSAALMNRCGLFVGTDSGPAHVASAVGCPLVVLFGPGNAHVMRPYTARSRIVASPRPCDPRCHNKTCAVPERHCLKAIGVEDVCAAAEELWRDRSSEPPARPSTTAGPIPVGTAP